MTDESKRLESLGPVLRPVRDAAELQRLQELAAADNHLVLAPTWVIVKVLADGHRGNPAQEEIVGYIGLNSLPLFQGWFDTKRINARDSVQIFNIVENLARGQGCQELGLLLPPSSPFAGKPIAALGYKHISVVGLELKLL